MAAGKKITYPYLRNQLQNKVSAYKTLMSQTTGSSKYPRPTPTQINSFCKYVDKGASLHYVSKTQLNRWAGQSRNWTTSSCKTVLCNRYGKNAIKAVAPNKTGGWIVATMPTFKSKTFNF